MYQKVMINWNKDLRDTAKKNKSVYVTQILKQTILESMYKIWVISFHSSAPVTHFTISGSPVY